MRARSAASAKKPRMTITAIAQCGKGVDEPFGFCKPVFAPELVAEVGEVVREPDWDEAAAAAEAEEAEAADEDEDKEAIMELGRAVSADGENCDE